MTANPSLVAKAERDFIRTSAARLRAIWFDGPVSAEVSALDAETMIAEGRKLAEIAENVTVRVLPMTWDGLKACRTLTRGPW